VDLEIGIVLAEAMAECSAVIVKDQKTLAVASGMVLPVEAVDYALGHIAGESEGAVCVLTGEVYSDHLFNALIQARIAGVLLLNGSPLPQPLVDSLKKLPFFAGTYTDQGINPVLQHAGVRHG
jgi:hypothetical protein